MMICECFTFWSLWLVVSLPENGLVFGGCGGKYDEAHGLSHVGPVVPFGVVVGRQHWYREYPEDGDRTWKAVRACAQNFDEFVQFWKDL